MSDEQGIVGRMPWPQTGATKYHVHLGLPDKGRAIKELVVCNSSRALGPVNGLALGCYQPSPEVVTKSNTSEFFFFQYFQTQVTALGMPTY